MSKAVELEEEEKEEILFLMSEYKQKSNRLDEIQKKLEELRSEHSNLESELNQTREREKQMIERLSNKYGMGSLDPETLKFYPGIYEDKGS